MTLEPEDDVHHIPPRIGPHKPEADIEPSLYGDRAGGRQSPSTETEGQRTPTISRAQTPEPRPVQPLQPVQALPAAPAGGDHTPRQPAAPLPPAATTPRLPPPPSVSETPFAAPPRHTATPFDFSTAEDHREHVEQLKSVVDQLHDAVRDAERGEERREVEFQQHEEDRATVFAKNEQRRDQEAIERADGIWSDLEKRLASLPSLAVPPGGASAEDVGDKASLHSIHAASDKASARFSQDVMSIIQVEKDDLRDSLEAQHREEIERIREECARTLAAKDEHIQSLQNDVIALRAEVDAERQQRNEQSEFWENQRTFFEERDASMRQQLEDLTRLVEQQQIADAEEKAVKEERRTDKDARMAELIETVRQMQTDMNAARNQAEDDRADNRDALNGVLEDVRRQNNELQELLRALSNDWREDCERHHAATIDAVRANSQEQVYFNVQGYLDEFSRALATEVRLLLADVGKIREERRALQHEIGDLLLMKSKYGPGGEYEPEWKPAGDLPPEPPAEPPSMPDPMPGAPRPARPAWRATGPPHEKKKKKKKDAQPPPAASTSMPPPQPFPGGFTQEASGPRQSWQPWYPTAGNISPPEHEPTLLMPERSMPQGPPALFGPRTPSTTS